MTYLTNQQIFDKVAAHLLKQRHVAYAYADRACVYRDTRNRACAVGGIIPDDAYNPLMEGHVVGAFVGLSKQAIKRKLEWEPQLALAKALDAAGVPCEQSALKLLDSLQVMHDSWALDQKFRAVPKRVILHDLSAVARDHNLHFNPEEH